MYSYDIIAEYMSIFKYIYIFQAYKTGEIIQSFAGSAIDDDVREEVTIPHGFFF